MAIFNKKTEEKESKAAAPTTQTVALPKNILQPRISEKSARLGKSNKYVFVVDRKTNKIEVKKAIEKSYKVTVLQVNMVNVKGKVRNFGRISGKTSPFKKAIVSLKEGDKIDSAEIV